MKNIGTKRIKEQFGKVQKLESKYDAASQKALNLITQAKNNITVFEGYEGSVSERAEKEYFKNMLVSIKLKVQNSARQLRTEQEKIYKKLNMVELSGYKVDFFSEDKKMSFFDEEENNTTEQEFIDKNNQ